MNLNNFGIKPIDATDDGAEDDDFVDPFSGQSYSFGQSPLTHEVDEPMQVQPPPILPSR